MPSSRFSLSCWWPEDAETARSALRLITTGSSRTSGSRAAFDISRAIREARGNNADALFAMLNKEINAFVGEPKSTRHEWTAQQLQAAYDSLDEIGDEVAGTIHAALREEN